MAMELVPVIIAHVHVVHGFIVGEPAFCDCHGAELEVVVLCVYYFGEDVRVAGDADGEDLLEDVDGGGAEPTIRQGVPGVDLFLKGVGRIPDCEVFLHLDYKNKYQQFTH